MKLLSFSLSQSGLRQGIYSGKEAGGLFLCPSLSSSLHLLLSRLAGGVHGTGAKVMLFVVLLQPLSWQRYRGWLSLAGSFHCRFSGSLSAMHTYYVGAFHAAWFHPAADACSHQLLFCWHSSHDLCLPQNGQASVLSAGPRDLCPIPSLLWTGCLYLLKIHMLKL